MQERLKENQFFLILIFLSFLVHFSFLNYPPEVVFDEVHFGKFVSAYFDQRYYFDIHPPLGKLMIAGFFKIFGGGVYPIAENSFLKIGENLNTKTLFLLRFLPALFGALFVILVYKLVLLFGFSKNSAFLAGFFVLFDNAFLAQSKFILLDLFLIFFGAAAIYFYFLSRKKTDFSFKNICFLILSAVFSAFSFSVKWTGLTFLLMIFIAFLFDEMKAFNVKRLFFKVLVFSLIPFLIYFLIFFIHLKILSKSGPGDAYMSPAFQKNLTTWQKFTELNKAMLKYNAGIKTAHPYSSKWYQWPFGKKAIWYWSKKENGETGNIYLMPNFFVWWASAGAVIFSLFAVLRKKWRKKLPPLFYFLLLGYFINLLPYIFIERPTFLYHYFPSLFFAILLLTLFFEKIILPKPKEYVPFLIVAFLFFLILSPLTYGFLMPQKISSLYNFLLKFLL